MRVSSGLAIELAVVAVGLFTLWNEVAFHRRFSALRVGSEIPMMRPGSDWPSPNMIASIDDKVTLAWQGHLLPMRWFLDGDAGTRRITSLFAYNWPSNGAGLIEDPPEPPADTLFRLAFLFSVLHLSWRLGRGLLPGGRGGRP